MEPFRKTCGFDFYIVSNKIKSEILNGRIEKIYFIKREKGYIIKLVIYKQQKKFLLIMNNAIFVYENDIIENPTIPSTFTMVLRKYLENKFITNMMQCNNDKILCMKTENNLFYIEFFGDGNAILCDNENRIVDALIKREWKGRTIKMGEIYKFPENKVTNNMFFGVYFNEVKDKASQTENVLECGIKILADKEVEILEMFKNLITSSIKRDYEVEKIEKEIKKAEFIAEQQRERIKELGNEANAYTKIGDKIYQNFSIIEEILENVRNKRAESRIKAIEGNNVVVEI